VGTYASGAGQWAGKWFGGFVRPGLLTTQQIADVDTYYKTKSGASF
jgi:hypothetical protein